MSWSDLKLLSAHEHVKALLRHSFAAIALNTIRRSAILNLGCAGLLVADREARLGNGSGPGYTQPEPFRTYCVHRTMYKEDGIPGSRVTRYKSSLRRYPLPLRNRNRITDVDQNNCA